MLKGKIITVGLDLFVLFVQFQHAGDVISLCRHRYLVSNKPSKLACITSSRGVYPWHWVSH